MSRCFSTPQSKYFLTLFTFVSFFYSASLLANPAIAEAYQFKSAKTLSSEVINKKKLVKSNAMRRFGSTLDFDVAALEVLQAHDVIDLDLNGQIIRFELTKVNRLSSGKIDIAAQSLSSSEYKLNLTRSLNGIRGTVHSSVDKWEIIGDSDSVSVYSTEKVRKSIDYDSSDFLTPKALEELRKDHSSITDDAPLNVTPVNPPSTQKVKTTGINSRQARTATVSDQLNVIDVMVIYSETVDAMYPEGALVEIEQAFDVSNQIFKDSGVNTRLNLVAKAPVSYPDNIFSNIALMELTSGMGVFSGVKDAQDEFGADVVVLFRPLNIDDLLCGIANLNDHLYAEPAQNADNMYSVVAIECGGRVLAHELGHNLGLNHSRKQDGEGVMLPYALGYGVNNRFATVMAYEEEFGGAIGVDKFSSPLLDCFGQPCGISHDDDPNNSADAVSALNQVVGKVAAYRQTTVTDDHGNNRFLASELSNNTNVQGMVDSYDDSDWFVYTPTSEQIVTFSISTDDELSIELVSDKGEVVRNFSFNGTMDTFEQYVGKEGVYVKITSPSEKQVTYSIEHTALGVDTQSLNLTFSGLGFGDAYLKSEHLGINLHCEPSDSSCQWAMPVGYQLDLSFSTGDVTELLGWQGCNVSVGSECTVSLTQDAEIVVELALTVKDDVGNDFHQAKEVSYPQAIEGSITYAKDEDFFKFTLTQDTNFVMSEEQLQEVSLIAFIYDEQQNLVAFDDNAGLLFQERLAAGTYYLKVENFLAEAFTQAGNYRLLFALPESVVIGISSYNSNAPLYVEELDQFCDVHTGNQSSFEGVDGFNCEYDVQLGEQLTVRLVETATAKIRSIAAPSLQPFEWIHREKIRLTATDMDTSASVEFYTSDYPDLVADIMAQAAVLELGKEQKEQLSPYDSDVYLANLNQFDQYTVTLTTDIALEFKVWDSQGQLVKSLSVGQGTENIDLELGEGLFYIDVVAVDPNNAGDYKLTINAQFSDGDSDGMSDAWEAYFGLAAKNDDSLIDTDGDGLSNKMEYHLGTDPTQMDMDRDGLTDKDEIEQGLNPFSDDSDQDGIADNDDEYPLNIGLPPGFEYPNPLITDINFVDNNLEQCIKSAAEKNGWKLSDEVNNLECNSTKITSLEGLQHFRYLSVIELSNNNIEDLNPLTELPRLISLYVSSNNISSLSALSKMKFLTVLSIGNNPIEDWSGLANLTQLTGLDMVNAVLTNASLESVSGLTSLTSLNLASNNLTNISAVERLMDLEFLNLQYNPNLECDPLGPTWYSYAEIPLACFNDNVKIDFDGDGDGKADIVWRNSKDGRNWLWTMNGRSVIKSAGISTIANSAWQMVGRGDFNDDGKSDILWRNQTTGLNYIWMMDGFAFSERKAINTVADLDWQIKAVADFNGDGKSDILWHHQITGQTYIYLMDGFQIMARSSVRYVDDINWQIQATSDVNADGKSDVIWRHERTGANYIWLMDGYTLEQGYVLNTVAGAWDIVDAGDLNGDGHGDIVWRNSVDGRNWAYLMKDGQIEISRQINTVSGVEWQIKSIADFDGDGKADIFWHSQTTGLTYIYLMDGAAITSRGALNVVSPDWQVIGK
jgi:hypothetical protein